MPLQRFLERLIWACTAPLALMTALLAGEDVIELEDRGAAAASAMLEHLIRNIDDGMETRIRALRVLAASPSLDPPADHAAFYREAQAYREVFGSHVVLVGASKQMLLNTRVPYGEPLPLTPLSACRAAELAMLATGQPAVCGRFRSPFDHSEQVILKVPVLRQGQPAQFLGVPVAHALLQQQLNQLGLAAGWSIALLDTDGQPIARRAAAPSVLPGLDSLHRRWSSKSAVTGWSAVLEIDALAYYRPLLLGGASLLLGLMFTTLVAMWGVRRTGRQLAQAVAALSQSPGGPEAPAVGPPPLEIREITAARRALAGLVAARDEAQAAKLELEKLGKAKLESALAAMNDAVVITDAQGRFTDFNHAFRTAHRFKSLEECHGTLAEHSARTELFLLSGELLTWEQWPISRALRGETADIVELELRRKGSDETWVMSYSYAPIRGDDGAIIGSVTTGRDMTETRRVQEALLQSHRDLRHLVAQMSLVEEKERQRIARELHDELQQSLGVIRLDLQAIGQQCAVDGPGAAQRAGQAVTLVDGAIASIRRIVCDLRPQILDELGLADALGSMVKSFGERHGVGITLDILGREDGDGPPAPPTVVATALYRITQEALNNVHKHAQASFVYVFLDLSSAERIELLINDDGQGLPTADSAKTGSFGLRGMRERAQALGGSLEIRSTRARGTTVRACLPLGPAGEGLAANGKTATVGAPAPDPGAGA